MSATQRWDEAVEHPDMSLAGLVEGLDAIGAQPIPYQRLPVRARTVYGSSFITWSDVAAETISSLMGHPKAGTGTVRALVGAARDAVAAARSTGERGSVDAATAARELLDRLTERDRVLLTARVWTSNPEALPETGRRVGLHGGSVLRNQRRAEGRVAELLADPAHQDLVQHAETLSRRLGPVTREHAIRETLADLGLGTDGDAGRLLLHLAGPYAERDGWMEQTPTADSSRGATTGLLAASEAMADAFAQLGAPSVVDLTARLECLGLAPEIIADFVESWPGARRVGDRWIPWGISAGDNAAAALHLLGAPASADVITATIGGDRNPRTVREALYADARFIRVTKTTWALSSWNLKEYSGVFDEIAGRIDAAGGAISMMALLRDMTSTFPDVAQGTIRTFTSAPGFTVEDGMVRRRTDADPRRPRPQLHLVRGAFHNGPDQIRLAITVTGQVLRGSGNTIHTAVAVAMGLTPGDRRTFTGPIGDLVLVWPLSTVNGANAGSLRAFTTATGCVGDDTLLLVFGLRDDSIDAMRIATGEDPLRRLPVLLGKPVTDPLAALARGLRCPPEDVGALLRRRGEEDLLQPDPADMG